MGREAWRHLVADLDGLPDPDVPEGRGAGDYSREYLRALRGHAAALNDCGLLFTAEYEVMASIVSRCDGLLRQHGQAARTAALG